MVTQNCGRSEEERRRIKAGRSRSSLYRDDLPTIKDWAKGGGQVGGLKSYDFCFFFNIFS